MGMVLAVCGFNLWEVLIANIGLQNSRWGVYLQCEACGLFGKDDYHNRWPCQWRSSVAVFSPRKSNPRTFPMAFRVPSNRKSVQNVQYFSAILMAVQNFIRTCHAAVALLLSSCFHTVGFHRVRTGP